MESNLYTPGRHSYRQLGRQGKAFDPEPEQIARLCEEIQRTWDEQEREARRWWYPVVGCQSLRRPVKTEVPAMETAVVSTRDLEAA